MLSVNEIDKLLNNTSDISLDNYKSFENLRDIQQETICKIIDAFNKGKKYFILEAPTGIGKSAIATTIANYYSNIQNIKWDLNDKIIGSYIIVHQKILQDQYINEKWFKILNETNVIDCIKSASNYECQNVKHLDNVKCSDIMAMKGGYEKKSICKADSCIYQLDREKFYKNKTGLTNIQYFLTASAYSKHFKKKNLLIIDEAHTIEDSILNHITFDISEWICNTKLKLQIPNLIQDQEIINWIKNEYLYKLIEVNSQIKDELEKFEEKNYNKNEIEEIKSKIINLEYTAKCIDKVSILTSDYDDDTWVIDRSKTKTGLRSFSLKPVFINKYSKELLFDKANKFLLMSATILNKNSYCNSVGIKESEVEFISLDSLFDPSKRPIYYTPVGKMAKDTIKETLPNLARAVSLIMEQYKNKKGVIHCHTYEIAEYLKANVSSEHKDRLINHTSENRDKALEFHINSQKATVLLSPSMSEGVDLKDHLSRFQIICKIPFPYLGDRRIMKKKKIQPWWYPYQTAKIIVQGLGRSIRNEEDYADSYILDSNWAFFLKLNKKYFPKWFLSAIKN